MRGDLINKFVQMVKKPNPCQHCLLAWEDVGPEDIDAGCWAGVDEFEDNRLVCLRSDKAKKRLLQKYLSQQDKEHKDFFEYVKSQEEIIQQVVDLLYESLHAHDMTLAYQNLDDELVELNLAESDILHVIAGEIVQDLKADGVM